MLPAMLVGMQANLYALGAIALWASLAALGVALKHLPPFLLTGIALMVGGLLAVPFVVKDRRQWKDNCAWAIDRSVCSFYHN